MAQAQAAKKGFVYQATAVIVAGFAIWLWAAACLPFQYPVRDQLTLLALVPLVVITGMFPNTFPVPSGLKCTHEKISFTLTDAIVLLVACWYGIAPAIFVAGVEGFTSSRRTVRRLSSNLFSFGMMALAAAASSACLGAVLHYGFGEPISKAIAAGRARSFPAIAVALLVASIVHIIVNSGLFSVFFALRQGSPILRTWKQNFLWAAPIFLPTSAVASLMYVTLQYDALMVLVIGLPVMLALYFGHRQYRKSVQERMSVMDKAHRETIEALAVAINAKDEVTHEHVLRVQIYAAGVARILGCTEAEIEALKAGSLLHDIGKIAVPDYILNKPGKLTAAEFEKMKVHTTVGAQILGRVEFPYPVVPVVRHHHERWDGRGYPDGLKGEEIPLTARILTVVDCFDAVREDRQYRKGMTREEAINLIMQGSGTQYDPRVVGTFITHLPEFEAEIHAHRDVPAPTFGIEPVEQLSEAARLIAPAAGLAEVAASNLAGAARLSEEQQETLSRLSHHLGAAHDPDEIIHAFLDQLNSLVPYDSCTVTLTAPFADNNVVSHAAGQHSTLLLGRQITVGEGVTGWVLANRQSFCNSDPKLDLPPSMAEHFSDYRTLAVFPIVKDSEIYGALTLYSATLARYEADHQHLLEAAVSHLASALAAKTKATAPRFILQPSSQLESTKNVPAFKTPAARLTAAVLESELTH